MNNLLKLNKSKIKDLLEVGELDVNLLKHLFGRYQPDEEILQFAYRNYRNHSDVKNYLENYKGFDSDGNIVQLSQDYLDRFNSQDIFRL